MELAEYVRDLGYMPEQVQDFYPTPGTISTCMYHTGLDPRTMKPVYVPKSPREKAMQRALIQYRKPENYELVKEALHRAGRTDLIGFGEKCLIPPRKMGKGRSGGAVKERPVKDCAGNGRGADRPVKDRAGNGRGADRPVEDRAGNGRGRCGRKRGRKGNRI